MSILKKSEEQSSVPQRTKAAPTTQTAPKAQTAPAVVKKPQTAPSGGVGHAQPAKSKLPSPEAMLPLNTALKNAYKQIMGMSLFNLKPHHYDTSVGGNDSYKKIYEKGQSPFLTFFFNNYVQKYLDQMGAQSYNTSKELTELKNKNDKYFADEVSAKLNAAAVMKLLPNPNDSENSTMRSLLAPQDLSKLKQYVITKLQERNAKNIDVVASTPSFPKALKSLDVDIQSKITKDSLQQTQNAIKVMIAFGKAIMDFSKVAKLNISPEFNINLSEINGLTLKQLIEYVNNFTKTFESFHEELTDSENAISKSVNQSAALDKGKEEFSPEEQKLMSNTFILLHPNLSNAAGEEIKLTLNDLKDTNSLQKFINDNNIVADQDANVPATQQQLIAYIKNKKGIK